MHACFEHLKHSSLCVLFSYVLCAEPLADFKAAVKRSISNRLVSTTSSTQQSFSRQASRQDDVSAQVPGLSDYLSRFSMDDLPITGAPSPLPGRIRVSTSTDIIGDNDSDSDDEGEEEKVHQLGTMYCKYYYHNYN